MAFGDGGVTARRYRCSPREAFGDAEIAALEKFSIAHKITLGEDAGDSTYGWTGGLDAMDADLLAEKNLRGEFLVFGFRVETTKIPPDVLKARVRTELAALCQDGKKPTAKQKREAKEAAMDALAEEAKDGRWAKRTVATVVWDQDGQVWVGLSSHAHLGQFEELFLRTFAAALEPIAPKVMGAAKLPELEQRAAWLGDGEEANEWGNRFGLWLVTETMGGREEFAAASDDLTLMVAGRVTFDCPRADKGKDSFTHPLPVRMPEVRQAVKEGKLPTALGLEWVAAGDAHNWKFTLVPHDWVVTGLKVPKGEGGSDAERECDRLHACRRFFRALDALYGEYVSGLDPALALRTAVEAMGDDVEIAVTVAGHR